MSSPASQNGRSKFAPDDDDDTGTPFLTPLPAASPPPSSRRTPSFFSFSSPSRSSNSSLGSSSSSHGDSPLFSPSTPRRCSGIPFSWEKLPGIPKKQHSKKNDPSLNLLPLPPAGTTPIPFSCKKFNSHEISPIIRKKYAATESFRWDPFFAALVECSKDHGDQDPITSLFAGGSKVACRTLSERFGFISTYASCKRSCPVSQSIICIPSPRPRPSP